MKSDEMQSLEYIKLTNGRARSEKKKDGHDINWAILIKKAKDHELANHGSILWMLKD